MVSKKGNNPLNGLVTLRIRKRKGASLQQLISREIHSVTTLPDVSRGLMERIYGLRIGRKIKTTQSNTAEFSL
jgi:hypothetical protein